MRILLQYIGKAAQTCLQLLTYLYHVHFYEFQHVSLLLCAVKFNEWCQM